MDQELLDFEAPHNGTPTSQMAAEEIKPHLGRLQSEVYSFLLKKGSAGATCDEVEVALGLSHQTASARLYELRRKGRAEDSGHTRLTRSKRSATVWVHADVPPQARGSHKSLTQRHRELRDSYNLLKQKMEKLDAYSKRQAEALDYAIQNLSLVSPHNVEENIDKILKGEA